MISGLGQSSSGIASALRTASKARATMDTMARQIATGQKVASVKDDGAAWARAAALKSDIVRHETVSTWGKRGQVVQETSLAAMEGFGETIARAREIVTQAILAEQTGASRSALKADYDAIIGGLDSYAANTVVDGISYLAAHVYNPSLTPITQYSGGPPYVWGIKPFENEPGYGDFIIQMETYAGVWPVNSLASDIEALSGPALSSLASTLDYYSTWIRHQIQAIGSVTNANERIIDRADAAVDRTTAAIGTLTDADMGKASAARAQAETRQQLALSTVRQALDAYGTYAGGLLGNVQRTQRGVMA
jgi:flagellin-like hook-associated protein FlgL